MLFGRTTPWLTPRYPGDLARGRGPRSGPGRIQPATVTSGAIASSDLVVLAVVMATSGAGSPLGVCGFLVLTGGLLAAQGQFRSRITLSLVGDVGPILTSVAASLVAVSILGGFDHHVAAALHAGIVAVVVVIVLRALLYAGLRALRMRRVLAERTLVLGSGQLAARFADVLREHREYGLVPVGFLDDVDGPDDLDDVTLPAPLLGRVPHLPSVIVEHGVQRVVIAFGAARESAMVDIVRACVDASVNVHVLPRFFELGWTPRDCQMDDVWGYPLVRLPHSSWRPLGRLAKRALDIVVASAALLAVSPLYLALAIAVKVSSPGPVYFRQVRVGERSRPVEILKFRSMRVNDDADVTWDVGDDERVTVVGRLMRDFSLDELPQLWNVVRGDMSLVGPRPERPYFVERFRDEIDHYDRRHRMPGGLTGLAQVHGLRGARTSIEDRARLDNHYIQTWSFWRDLAILVRTPIVVLHHAWRDRVDARPKVFWARAVSPRGWRPRGGGSPGGGGGGGGPAWAASTARFVHRSSTDTLPARGWWGERPRVPTAHHSSRWSRSSSAARRNCPTRKAAPPSADRLPSASAGTGSADGAARSILESPMASERDRRGDGVDMVWPVTRVGVLGAAGRMGRAVCRAVGEDPELDLVAAVDPHLSSDDVAHLTSISADVQLGADIEVLGRAGATVAVDFTVAEAAMEHMRWCAAHGVHAVVGTTGLTPAFIAETEAQWARGAANCVIAPNFAIGAVLMMRFAEMAAPYMESAEIVELHHDGKLDAPSGTALLTAQRMADARRAANGGPWPADRTATEVVAGARGGVGAEGLHLHSVRLPGLVAHQEVVFGATGQSLTIRHDAYDRTSFMPGVLMAVRAVAQRPGLTIGLDALLGL